MRIIHLLCLIGLLPQIMSAAEKAFHRTDVGQIEIKTLPSARLIASTASQSYFENNGRLFRPLFRYIQSKDIAMTTPVEAEIEPGVMYFYIGEDVAEETLKPTEEVSVHEVPERVVASIGVRGGYSEKNFIEAEAKLRSWLASEEKYEAAGAARGIYWNGPFTPGIFKRFEVHIPVSVK